MSRYDYNPVTTGVGALQDITCYAEACACLKGRSEIGPAIIQRALKCGYNHAQHLLHCMELKRLVGTPDRYGKRPVVQK